MFLFLSSGAREQYRQDVLRAIAQPAGSLLQFRYESGLLQAAVLKQISDNPRSLDGKPGLIVFLDRKDAAPNQEPDLVPCRYVKIHRVDHHGTTVTVQLRLGAYPRGVEAQLTAYLAGFNAEAKQALQSGYPKWEKNDEGARVGNIKAVFWSEVKDNWESVKPQPDAASWKERAGAFESIVAALQPREHFNTEPYFFLFRGIRTVAEGDTTEDARTLVDPDDRGVYPLEVGKQYELLIYHFMPGDPVPATRSSLTVTASNPVIEFTSGVTFALDSGYDQKAARFTVTDTATTTRGVFTISGKKTQVIEGEDKETEVVWFDLPLEIPRNWLWVAVKGALLASPIAIGPAAAALANEKIDPTIRGWIVVLSLLGACTGGALTALFGKK